MHKYNLEELAQLPPQSLATSLMRTEQAVGAEQEAHNRTREVLGKIWNILADGERALNPDADPEFDVNNVYGLVREGCEARKTLKRVRECAEINNCDCVGDSK